MSGLYRMTWPVLDARVPLADLLHHAEVDLTAALNAESLDRLAVPTWRLHRVRGKLHLTGEVKVTAEPAYVPPPPKPREPGTLQPCGTHAAYARHKVRKEPMDPDCLMAERKYQRERKRDRTAPPRRLAEAS